MGYIRSSELVRLVTGSLRPLTSTTRNIPQSPWVRTGRAGTLEKKQKPAHLPGEPSCLSGTWMSPKHAVTLSACGDIYTGYRALVSILSLDKLLAWAWWQETPGGRRLPCGADCATGQTRVSSRNALEAPGSRVKPEPSAPWDVTLFEHGVFTEVIESNEAPGRAPNQYDWRP